MTGNITPEEMLAFKIWFVEKWEAWEFTYRHRSSGPMNFSALNLRRLLKQTAQLYIAIKQGDEIDTSADWVSDAWISFLLRPKNASAPEKYDQAYLTKIEPFLGPRFLAGHSFTVRPNSRENGPIAARGDGIASTCSRYAKTWNREKNTNRRHPSTCGSQ